MLIGPIFQMLGDQWASLFDKCRDLKMMLKNGHQNVTKVITSIVIRGCGGFADSERCTIVPFSTSYTKMILESRISKQ